MKKILTPPLFLIFLMFFVSVNVFASDKIKRENEDLLQSVIKLVQDEYIDETVEDEIVESAINGMLQSLDPHSLYLNQEDFKELTSDTKGEFGGLGIEVTMEKGLVKVISPIDKTPAERAGIVEGDFITHINKDPILGKSLSEAVSLMRGKPNTEIEITIAREGLDEGFDLKLIREVIKVPGVLVSIKGEGNDIGYIRVSSFNEKTSDELYKEIIKFEFNPNNQIKSYILDLRRNPGGLLSQAIQVTNFFLDEGNIVSTKRPRFDKIINEYKAKKGDLIFGKPLLVIVNGGSASASEIVAGALQDNKRAIILGTKTFGKGSVQTLFPLEKSNLFSPNDLYGAVKLTTAEYFTPSGRSIQARGIEPDIIINQTLENEGYDSVTVGETKLNKYIKNENENIESGSSAYIPPEEIDDIQLNEAIKILSNLNMKI